MVFARNRAYLLFDDDCGICTMFAKFFRRLLYNNLSILPMHLEHVEKEGLDKIGDDYWKSFHIVKNGNWTTESNAIFALATLFPLGNILTLIAQFPPVHFFLRFVLHKMQNQRKIECEIEFTHGELL